MTRLWEACAEGLVLGAKYAVALLVVGSVLGVVVGDYLRVRADATYAASVIRATLKAQQQGAK